MIDFYIHQLKGSEIGNFINTTPLIATLFKHYKEKIPVNFDTPLVRDMFLHWDKIEIVSKKQIKNRGLKRLFHCGITNSKKPDWMWLHEKFCNQLGVKVKKIPHTYVDKIPTFLKGDYAVILRGCHHKSVWKRHKECGDNIYKYIIRRVGRRVVFVGSDYDLPTINRMRKWKPNHLIYLNDTRKTLSLINGARFIVGNDTGMYHAAGALNKYIFVLWKTTNFRKNRSPGKNCFFSFPGNWQTDFDEWIKQFKEG